MGTNKQVFGSNSERSNYYKLSRQWGNTYRIYHNLPFLNVFNTKGLLNPRKLGSWAKLFDPNERAELVISAVDFNRLKKTSIDFTLCDDNDKPLLCIEFDGIKDGFNVGTEYRFDGPPDPWRELITGLKLQVAHGSLFPFFVVGFDHFKDLAEDIQLTMVDGIIGAVLANLETQQRVGQGFDPDEVGWTQEDFDKLPSDEQHEIIQDWLLGVEVEAEMKHNPISRKVGELEREVGYGCSVTWLSYPNADKAKSLSERREILDSAITKGCRCCWKGRNEVAENDALHHPGNFGPVSATVWLPNFQVPGCACVLGLVENLAKLVALAKVRKLMQRQGG